VCLPGGLITRRHPAHADPVENYITYDAGKSNGAK
jgi:hypothetical protein